MDSSSNNTRLPEVLVLPAIPDGAVKMICAFDKSPNF